MNYNDENLLEMVELYASEANLPYWDEEALSHAFDRDIMPGIIEQCGKKGEAFDDETMVNEEFNNWSDMLCKDGEIHPEQYANYCYVGEYSN